MLYMGFVLDPIGVSMLLSRSLHYFEKKMLVTIVACVDKSITVSLLETPMEFRYMWHDRKTDKVKKY